MGKRSKTKCRGEFGRLVLILASGCLIPAHAATKSQDTNQGLVAEIPVRQVLRHDNRHGLEERVKTLSQALGLDATQQSELRKALESQREQVKKIWNDASMSAAYRVSATQAVSDKTADQIRALLNEEQRKKYKPPAQHNRQHNAADGSAKPGVEDWMNAAKPKQVGPK